MSHPDAKEALVVLDESATPQLRADIERDLVLLQSVSPRMFVVSAAPQDLAQLAQRAEVIAATAAELPAAIVATLNAPERQWAAGWNLRRTEKKARRGDGLAWDAPGFSPPDRGSSGDEQP